MFSSSSSSTHISPDSGSSYSDSLTSSETPTDLSASVRSNTQGDMSVGLPSSLPFSSVGMGAPNNTPPQRKNRQRKTMSCSFCRHRKLKCDRNLPCSNCVKKGMGLNCTYASRPQSDVVTHPNGVPIPMPKLASGNTRGPNTFAGGTGGTSGRATLDQLQSMYDSISKRQGSTNAPSASRARSDDRDDVRQRLEQMENLVMAILREKNSSDQPSGGSNLASNNNNNNSDAAILPAASMVRYRPKQSRQSQDDEMQQLGDSLGFIKLDRRGKSVYHGDTHWSTLFSGFEEVQSFFKNLRKSYEASQTVDPRVDACTADAPGTRAPFTQTPFGSSPGVSMNMALTGDEIIALVPRRDICDQLVARYFSTFQVVLPVVHKPTFDVIYLQFWEDPNQIELVSMALLLCVLTLGLQSYVPTDVPDIFKPNPMGTWKSWQAAIETCGYAGRITIKPSLLNLRVMILWMFTHSSEMPNKDWAEVSWITLGSIVRVAQGMGLHRNPKWFSLSQFESEERKRLWMIVLQLDSFFSMIQGLPKCIHTTDTDDFMPRNIDESQIMPDSSLDHVVPEQDMSVETSVTFLIYFSKVSAHLAEALELNFNTAMKRDMLDYYSKIEELCNRLQVTYNEVPAMYRIPVAESTYEESSVVILRRFVMELEYLKTITVAYRAFSSVSFTNTKYHECRERLIQASTVVLERAAWLHESPVAKTTLRNNWVLLTVWSSQIVIHAFTMLALTLLNNYNAIEPTRRSLLMQMVEKGNKVINFNKFSPMYDTSQSILISVLARQVASMQYISEHERDATRWRLKTNASEPKAVFMEMGEIGSSGVGSIGTVNNTCISGGSSEQASPEYANDAPSYSSASVDGPTPESFKQRATGDSPAMDTLMDPGLPASLDTMGLDAASFDNAYELMTPDIFGDEAAFKSALSQYVQPDEWDDLLTTLRHNETVMNLGNPQE